MIELHNTLLFNSFVGFFLELILEMNNIRHFVQSCFLLKFSSFKKLNTFEICCMSSSGVWVVFVVILFWFWCLFWGVFFPSSSLFLLLLALHQSLRTSAARLVIDRSWRSLCLLAEEAYTQSAKISLSFQQSQPLPKRILKTPVEFDHSLAYVLQCALNGNEAASAVELD